jgi:hypothetical protein
MIKLFGVAEFRMIAVSVISTMKVERPRALSEAPSVEDDRRSEIA